MLKLNDINYELAKKLKDAGFPQEDGHFYWFDTGTRSMFLECVSDESEALHEHSREYQRLAMVPTLSELIEACGDNVFLEVYKDTKSCSASNRPYSQENEKRGRGSTPEEAVANLWLELNKK